MGNGFGKIGLCLASAGEISGRHEIAFVLNNSLDEGLGHSFCYIRPDQNLQYPSRVQVSEENFKTTTFRAISGASVSANSFTPLSTTLGDMYQYGNSFDRAAVFESSTSFASLPLKPVPRFSNQGVPGSGPIERSGFLSGPIERGFIPSPIDRGLCSSSPVGKECDKLERSLTFSNDGFGVKSKSKSKKESFLKIFKKAISMTISRGNKSVVAPVKGVVSNKESDSEQNTDNVAATISSTNLSSHVSLNGDHGNDGDQYMESENLQWAQGKAGEDRVHVVVSEEHGWVFVGIYDGFNGPDAPDFLLSNLYPAVHKELKGLLWNEKSESECNSESEKIEQPRMTKWMINGVDKENNQLETGDINYNGKRKQSTECKCEFDRERLELDRNLNESLNSQKSKKVDGSVKHLDVLKALSQALLKTEVAFLDAADKISNENPELSLMGSCVLVMLMKGEDVYLMNVGDSRAVLAQKADPKLGNIGRERNELDQIDEEISNFDECDGFAKLNSIQLTMDHSTDVEEEVERIKKEHPDDVSAVRNKRVKGQLKVTRAFGAGFLKQPKLNDMLLEAFRVEYVGNSPYITCQPSVYHYKLNPRDTFLILSSDGLYQYFTNEEAVSEVELFIDSYPEGDPAQHLIEEVLFRAAKKAGMDFHQLLDIPQGERRRYHDDVSILIFSLEGRIWRSSV